MRFFNKSTHYLLLNLVIFPLLFLSINLYASNAILPVGTNSKEALDFFLKGREKFEDAEYTSANNLLTEAIKLDPEFALAYLYRSMSSIKGKWIFKDIENAKALANKADEGEKHFMMFYLASAKGKRFEQKEHLIRLLELYPDDIRVQYIAGIYFHSEDAEEALKHYQKAIELDDKFAPVYNLIGYIQTDLGNYREAEEVFKKYIELVPDNPNSYDSYAEFLIKTKRYDESIINYRKALELDSSYILALWGITEDYLLKGEFNKARDCCDELYDKASNNYCKYCALLKKAMSYIYEGRVEDAMLMLNECNNFAKKKNIPVETVTYSFSKYPS
jgi:tetratricopeptide (TPR) repeat protein